MFSIAIDPDFSVEFDYRWWQSRGSLQLLEKTDISFAGYQSERRTNEEIMVGVAHVLETFSELKSLKFNIDHSDKYLKSGITRAFNELVTEFNICVFNLQGVVRYVTHNHLPVGTPLAYEQRAKIMMLPTIASEPINVDIYPVWRAVHYQQVREHPDEYVNYQFETYKNLFDSITALESKMRDLLNTANYRLSQDDKRCLRDAEKMRHHFAEFKTLANELKSVARSIQRTVGCVSDENKKRVKYVCYFQHTVNYSQNAIGIAERFWAGRGMYV